MWPHLAVVTHAHSDQAHWGCQRYLAVEPCEQLLRLRVIPDAEFQFLPYGQALTISGVQISFHPAGNMRHLHSAYCFSSKTDSDGKLPYVWLSNRQLTLPEFGEFTGTKIVNPHVSDQTWVIVDDQIVRV